jgi:hypothetical protein
MTDPETIQAATDDERSTISALIAACTDFMSLAVARTGQHTDQDIANALGAGAAFSVIVQLSPAVCAALSVQEPGKEPEIVAKWIPAPDASDVH